MSPSTNATRAPARARSVVVRCASGSHRVRLASGPRLWASARCPVCRAPVDPRRWRRALALMRGLTRPAAPGAVARATWLLSLGYLGASVAAAALLWALADRWWPATVLLFGPRWVLALPLAVLIPAAALVDRALLIPLALAGLVVAGPVVGLRSGWRRLLVAADPARDVTVVTFNARGGQTLAVGPATLLDDWGADVAAFQECDAPLQADLATLGAEWSVDRRSSLCLVSRFPILAVEQMDREAFVRTGGSALVVTWTLDLRGREVHVTNVHLETPRAGFEMIRSGRMDRGVRRTREKSSLREAELRRTRTWVGAFVGPHLVMGDFNTPPESTTYRRAWGAWTNAFSVVGRGLGGTRLNGWIRARIDHVLGDDAWTFVDARTAADVGSDHLPLRVTARLEAGEPGDGVGRSP